MSNKSKVTELQKWHDEASSELVEANRHLVDAQAEVANLEEKIKSLETLLVLEGAMPKAEQKSAHDTLDSLIDAVEGTLFQAGHALRLADIREALSSEGVPIPGKGTDANLISRLQRSDGRIVRVGRGLYDIPREDHYIKLVFEDGRTVALGEETSIGRSDDNEVILADPQVSRKHAQIKVDDDTAMLKDLGTANGTLVNGRKVDEVELRDKDTIQVGDTVLTARIQ